MDPASSTTTGSVPTPTSHVHTVVTIPRLLEFLTWEEVLRGRLVCRAWRHAWNGGACSSLVMTRHLTPRLHNQNLTLLVGEDLASAWQSLETNSSSPTSSSAVTLEDRVRQFVGLPLETAHESRPQQKQDSPWQRLVRFLRVLPQFPQQLAMLRRNETDNNNSNNYQHQHHVVGMEWKTEGESGEQPRFLPIWHDSTKETLSSPTTSASSRQRFNLPTNLECPLCSSPRTLQLSCISYPATQPTEENATDIPPVLTLTPNTESASRPTKRPRKSDEDSNNETNPFFRLSHDPHSSDQQEESIRSNKDTLILQKHAMAIHCGSCRKFALVAPASLCRPHAFFCHAAEDTDAQPPTINSTTNDPPITGILVRTKCSHSSCPRAVLCHACAHSHRHTPRVPLVNDNNGESTRVLQQQPSQCQACQLSFCESHAWLATVCHHW